MQLDKQSPGEREMAVLELPGACFWCPRVASFSPKQEDVSDTEAEPRLTQQHRPAQPGTAAAVIPGTPGQWNWIDS